MKSIVIPNTVDEYREQLLAKAFPDERICGDEFYRKLIEWIIAHRTPILYEQTHSDEYTNFSINFNWLLLRDYSSTSLGPEKLILSMYSLHEFSHMTHWLPTNLATITPGEYAECFTGSEYIASNESEILIHYRLPSLRSELFAGQKIFFDTLIEAGTPQPTASKLYDIRAVIVEGDVLDNVLFPLKNDKPILERFKYYSGNRAWARARYQQIKPHCTTTPQSFGLTKVEYEEVIQSYEGKCTQSEYETNMIRNVQLGHAMCGLQAPRIETLAQAQAAAQKLEGHHAVI